MAEVNSSSQSPRALPGVVLKLLAGLSGILLLGLMVLITYAVVMRYFFNSPMIGSDEWVQLTMVAVVMLAMPYCAYSGTHIRVDIFDTALGAKGRFLTDIFYYLVGVFLLSLLTWKAYGKVVEAIEYEDTTNMLELPFWPVYSAMTFGLALYTLVLAGALINLLLTWRERL